MNEANEGKEGEQGKEQGNEHGKLRTTGLGVTGQNDQRIDIGAEKKAERDLAEAVFEEIAQDLGAVLAGGQGQSDHGDGECHAAHTDNRAGDHPEDLAC